jgi:hypothetical protein
LQFTLSILAWAEINTIGALDVNRKDQSNDHFDREIMAYGISYPTIFSAFDRWITAQISTCKRNGFPAIFNFSSNLNQLNHQLSDF